MIAYHGTALWKLEKLLVSIQRNQLRWPGLYVTDTASRAARYANAQASGFVDADAVDPGAHTAIVSVEIPDNTTWLRRKNPRSLDAAEAIVENASVTGINAVLCDYHNCKCCNDIRAAMNSGLNITARTVPHVPPHKR